MTKTIAITGLNGVIGEGLLTSNFFTDWKIVDLYHTKKANSKNTHCEKIDLENPKSVVKALENTKPDVILHMGAITHIDICEKDRKNGRNGSVWKVNVDSTREISNYSKKHETPIIFLSTECVFSGDKKNYSEQDKTNPKNWYGETKAQAEKILLRNKNSTIIRGVIAYDLDLNKKTILSGILSQLKIGKKFPVVDDQLFTPSYIPDIHLAIIKTIQNNLRGIFHVSSSQALTPLEFSRLIADHFGENKELIDGVSMIEFFGDDNAKLRLSNACLDNKMSIDKLGFTPKSPRDIFENKK